MLVLITTVVKLLSVLRNSWLPPPAPHISCDAAGPSAGSIILRPRRHAPFAAPIVSKGLQRSSCTRCGAELSPRGCSHASQHCHYGQENPNIKHAHTCRNACESIRLLTYSELVTCLGEGGGVLSGQDGGFAQSWEGGGRQQAAPVLWLW